MAVIFWLSFTLMAYAYFGYAALLWVQARILKRTIRREAILPSVSVIIAVRNEAANLPAKLENLDRLEYPREKLQIVIASDGSHDGTVKILQEHASTICAVLLNPSAGKAMALNEAVKKATGSILIFLDARQRVDADVVSQIVCCFVDPQIGAVSGELLLEDASGMPNSDALGIYWKLEKAIRKLESESGSVVGVTGAIYGIRRELYTEMPQGTILDDVFIPMNVARAGKRVIFQPAAIARDKLFDEKGKEFSRKVRTLTGNYQLLRLAPWLLSLNNPLLFRFISHKLLRLIVPLLLVLMLAASALAGGPFLRTVFWLQILLYALAFIGAIIPSSKQFKLIAIASTFVTLNAAATLAFCNFIAGRSKVWS